MESVWHMFVFKVVLVDDSLQLVGGSLQVSCGLTVLGHHLTNIK